MVNTARADSATQRLWKKIGQILGEEILKGWLHYS